MNTKPLPTLADIAAEAGVSLATASRVLSGSRDRVSERLAARVEAAARSLQYVPNAHAQALVRASSSTIGLIVHDVSDPYFAEIARGVLRAASEHDHLVMICNTFRDPAREIAYVGALRSQRVHAILLAGSGYTDPVVERQLAAELLAFRRANGRVASVGRHDLGTDTVQPDNVRGAALAARHLLDLGHEQLGILAGPASLTTVEDRIHGFRAEAEASGHTVPQIHVVHTDFTRSGGYEAVLQLLEHAPEASGAFALNDAMAVGALAACRDQGVDVPGELSLVGFDDIPLAADVVPPLTTVRLPMEDLGLMVVDLVLKADQVLGGTPLVIGSTSELIVRSSTAPPRAATHH